MTDRRRPVRRRSGGRGAPGRSEAGFSALELAVAMSLMVTVAVIGFRGVGAMFGLSTHTLDSAQSATVSGLAIHELSQEVSSANIIFDPKSDVDGHGSNAAGTNPDGTAIPAGFSLRIYTQNNGLYNCVQWRLLDTGALQVRQWQNGSSPPAWTSGSGASTNTSVRTLLSGLVNYAPPSPFSGQRTPFVLDAASEYGGSGAAGASTTTTSAATTTTTTPTAGRLLDVDLILDQHHTETPVEISSSIAGRDAWYYPANTGYCQTS